MDWRTTLAEFEKQREWDKAIELMIDVLASEKNNRDACLATLYLLMNLLVEEEYDRKKHDYYATLLKNYFDESYEQFQHDPAYLYYAGRIACMSEWYFDITIESAEEMLRKATILDPDNLVYQWTRYANEYARTHEPARVLEYCGRILEQRSPIATELKTKGALGSYILGMMEHWARRMIVLLKA